jgi:GTPase-associated protein 1, N-terminal domain type 2/GTPase-associated protein 1, middle domain
MTDSGQLLYTSDDPVGPGPGGWQVKQKVGVHPEELPEILALVSSSMPLLEDLPPYPSQAQQDALPRRLVSGRTATGARILVHSAPAGTDGTRRPGNVINHVLVRRRPNDVPVATSGRYMPLELWRASAWQTPWGAAAVRKAEIALDAVPVPLGGLLSRASVARLLGEAAPPRRAFIGALVDAIFAALHGGPSVVILVRDQDCAVLWLYSALLFADVATREDLTFSTWERAHDLHGAALLPHVVLVPAVDVDALAGLDVVVLDPDHQQPCQERRWPTVQSNVLVDSTPWSSVVQALCELSPQDLTDRLGAIDEISWHNPDAGRAAPDFPAALAVLEWQLPAARAAQDIALHVPQNGLDPSARDDLAAAAKAALGRTAADAAAALDRAVVRRGADPEVLLVIFREFLRRALSDEELLHGPWPPALPQSPLYELPEACPEAAHTISSALLGAAHRTCPAQVRSGHALRLLDFGRRLAVHGQMSREACREAGEIVVTHLFDAGGVDLFERYGPTAPGTAELLVDDLENRLVREPGRPGERLPRHLRRWLLEGLLPVLTSIPEALRQELAVLGVPNMVRYAPWRLEAVVAVLRSSWSPRASASAEARTTSALTRWGRGAPWAPEDLLTLHDRLRNADDVDLTGKLIAALEEATPGTAVAQTLAVAVLESDAHRGVLATSVVSLAQSLRHLAPGLHLVGPANKCEVVDLLLSGLAYQVDEEGRSGTAEALQPHLLVAAVQVTAWEATASGAPLEEPRRAALEQWRLELPVLSVAFPVALPLLLESLAQDGEQPLAPLVFRAVAHDVLHARSTFWSTQLEPEAVAASGRARLGEALLHQYLRLLPAPRRWLDAQLPHLRLMAPEERTAAAAWARALAAGTPPDLELEPEHSTHAERSTP